MRKVFNSLVFVLVTAIAVWVFFSRSNLSSVDIEIIEPQSIEIEDIAVVEKNVPEIEKLEKNIHDTAKLEKNNIPPQKVRTTGEKIAAEITEKVVVPGAEVQTPPAVVNEKVSSVENKNGYARDPPVDKIEPVQENKVDAAVKIVPLKDKSIVSAKVVKKAEAAAHDAEKVEKTAKYICAWNEDFMPDGHENGVKFVDDWQREGGMLFTPKTRFYLQEDKTARDGNVLVIESKKSSAVFACDLSGKVDSNKTPLLRWRWRVKKLPPSADGRHRKKDDQAVGIYIGAGNPFDQKAVAYRWETETPLGHWGKINYTKMMKVWFLCMRNKDNGLNVWYEECRNVKEDFIAKYGYVPSKIALVICGNSQNSQSDALAEIDFVGFYSEIKD